MFLPGRAGCGKTFMINCVNKYNTEILKAPNLLRLAAPTGSAAFQVNGETLHSLLQLPVPAPKKDPCPALTGDPLKRLQIDLKDLQILVIDEMSMISPLRLYQIDRRLRESKPEKSNKVFGGVSIVLMGDLAQLPPVCDNALFEVKCSCPKYEKFNIKFLSLRKLWLIHLQHVAKCIINTLMSVSFWIQ